MKNIDLNRFSPARAFFPESVMFNGRCNCSCKKPENNRTLHFFPDIDGYSCQSCDEPYVGVFHGEISFVSAIYYPESHSGYNQNVACISVRAISYRNKNDALKMFQEISAGYPVKENVPEVAFYHDAYSSESWLWVLSGANVVVCCAEHSASYPLPGPDAVTDEIRKILLDFAQKITKHTTS